MDQARLRAIPLFAELGRHEIEALSRSTDEVDVAEGRELVHEGDFGYEFFVIEDGRAHVRHGDETIAQLGAGDFFGEQALSGDARRSLGGRGHAADRDRDDARGLPADAPRHPGGVRSHRDRRPGPGARADGAMRRGAAALAGF